MNGKNRTTPAEDVERGPNTNNNVRDTLRRRLKWALLSNILVVLLIIAVLLGVGLGLLLRLRPESYTTRELLYLRFPGELLMNMLKFLILPLIVSSLITGMTSVDLHASGKLGLRAVVYYLTTTFMSVVLGIILVVIIQPGTNGEQPQVISSFRDVEPSDTFFDLIRQMFPSNMVEATFQKTLTKLKDVKPTTPSTPNNSSVTTPPPKSEHVPYLTTVKGINMLGVVTMSIAAGIAINHLGRRGILLKALFNSITDLTLVLISAVIWYSPIGILFLVVKEIVALKDPAQMFQQLSYYFLTVMLGLSIHGFVILPLIYFAVCRRNPYKFMKGMLQALVTAIGTGSSLATLPITMRNLEENNKVDSRVSGFVAPVGATINMDGTALYEAVAVIFIAQVEHFHLDFDRIIVIWLTATVAAIGAAGVPQAGLVTMVIVLTATGLPTDKIGLILSIDWLLDRFRTSINVLGDAYGAGIVDKLSRADLNRSAVCDLEINGPSPELDRPHQRDHVPATPQRDCCPGSVGLAPPPRIVVPPAEVQPQVATDTAQDAQIAGAAQEAEIVNEIALRQRSPSHLV